MIAYIIRRLIATIPVMLLVAVMVFLLVHLAPGDPASVIAGVSEEKFSALAHAAKENCPVSKALAATPISLTISYK